MAMPPNTYKPCTLNGPWFDVRKEPGVPQARPSVLTETQIRQAQVAGLPTPTYGAALASTYAHLKTIEQHFDYGNLVYYDRRYNGATSGSIQQTAHFGKTLPLDTADFSTSYRLGGPAVARDPAQLAAYRATHTTDARGAFAVAQRFTTAHASATGGAAVPLRFQPSPARALAGQVKACDLLLAKASDVHGWHAPLRLLLALPPSFDKLVLRAALARLGLRALTIDQEKELMRDLCASPEGHDMVAQRGALLERLTAPLAPAGAGAALRAAALARAWGQCALTAALHGEGSSSSSGSDGSGSSSARDEDAPQLPLGAILQCLDAANHPDARRAPAPLRTPAAAAAAVAGGLSAALRLAQQGNAATSPALAAAAELARTTLPVRPPRDGSVVSATLSSSVPLPLGTSRRVANGDFLVVRNTVVGVPGRAHADPAAGAGSARAREAGERGAVAACVDWGVPFGAPPGSEGGGGARGDGGEGAVGAPPLDAAARVAAAQAGEAEALLAPLPPRTRVLRGTFDYYFGALCGAASPSDDAFCRALDTLFHVALAPRVPSAAPAPQGPGQEGVVVPNRGGAGAQRSEASEWGAGLRFASAPYDPSLRTQPPRRAPPASDADAKFSQGSAVSVAVLVTHSDGRASVERLAQDRFMPSGSGGALSAEEQAGLLVRLRRQGVATAVSAQMAAF